MPLRLRHPVAYRNFNAYQRRRLGKRVIEQDRRVRALEQTPDEKLRRLAERIGNCCRHAMVAADDETGQVRMHEARCKARQCCYCGRVRANRCMARLMEALHAINSPRFLTLTVVSTDEPLHVRLAHLRESFKRLRRSKAWKAHIVGGIYTIEITWSTKRQQWHPHAHAIIDGSFWDQAELADTWERATGDSRIVDIRFVHDRQKQAGYLASYAGKSSDLDKVPDERLAEYVTETRDLRMLQTFGTLHNVATADEPDTEPGDWRCIAEMEDLTHAADDGDDFARQLIRYLWSPPDGELSPGLAAHLAETDGRLETLSCRVRRWRQEREEIRRARLRSTGPRAPSRDPCDRLFG